MVIDAALSSTTLFDAVSAFYGVGLDNGNTSALVSDVGVGGGRIVIVTNDPPAQVTTLPACAAAPCYYVVGAKLSGTR